MGILEETNKLVKERDKVRVKSVSENEKNTPLNSKSIMVWRCPGLDPGTCSLHNCI